MTKTYDVSKQVMLFSLSSSLAGLLGQRTDKTASALVEDTYSVDSKRVRTTKHLINQSAPSVRGVKSAYQNALLTVYKYGIPYRSTNLFLISAKVYPQFKAELDKAIERFHETVKDYTDNYPQLIQDAHGELNSLFDPSQYPAKDKIPTMFSINGTIMPFPTADNFLADIGTEAAAQVKQEIEANHVAVVEEAARHILQKLELSVEGFINKLQAFGQDPKAKRLFSSMVDNIKSTADLIEAINFTENANIAQLVHLCRGLGRFSIETLRESPFDREVLVNEGKSFLKDLEKIKQTELELAEEAAEMENLV